MFSDFATLDMPPRGSQQEQMVALLCVFSHARSLEEAAELAEMLGLKETWMEAQKRVTARKFNDQRHHDRTVLG